MAAPQSPVGSRRRLGAELRRLRTAKGLTLDEVAGQMTCSTSKISRLETGKGIPKVPDVRELMRIYGVVSDTVQDTLLRLVHDGREHGWWEPLTDGLAPERYIMDSPGRYAALENDATTVRAFDTVLVHGLLQTPDYARAVISPLLPHHSAEEIDRLIALRVKRQEALTRADPDPLRLVAVMDEAVLHRAVGEPATMTAQLARIQELAALPNVTIGVLPFTAGITRAHAGQFTLLEIPQALGSDVIYIEGHAGEAYLDSPSDVELYKDVHADALRRSLPTPESLNVIKTYQAKHAPPGRGSST